MRQTRCVFSFGAMAMEETTHHRIPRFANVSHDQYIQKFHCKQIFITESLDLFNMNNIMFVERRHFRVWINFPST